MKVKKLPRRIRVKVTARDIQRGWPRSTYSCPIALAARRACPRSITSAMRFKALDLIMPIWGPPPKIAVYRVPLKATRFVTAFDNGEQVKPFSFTAERATR